MAAAGGRMAGNCNSADPHACLQGGEGPVLPGQAQQLFDHLACDKTMMKFTDAGGAGAHCEVGAGRLAYARIYDWLDETLAKTE
jgi:hypothetical protein